MQIVSSNRGLRASQVVLVVENPLASTRDIEMQVRSLGQEDALGEGRATHSTILGGECHGQRSLEGYRPCCQRVRHD